MVTVLHPGAMGAQVGRLVAENGHVVRWVSAGRSTATRQRAADAGLQECHELSDALTGCDVVLSICPPGNAEDVARQMGGFAGVYLDANAIAPQRMQRFPALLPHARVLDGAIIGGPPRWPGATRLYLSGDVRDASELFAGSALEVITISDRVGQASALKMAFASYQKTSRVLAATAHALADRYGVRHELVREADLLHGRPLVETDALMVSAARAWRWAPEMDEIAATMDHAGLPSELARGAAQAMSRWAALRDRTDLDLAGVLARLGQHEPPVSP